MRTIALINNKGGVGKTSVTNHLLWALSRLGLKVTAVDNDGQRNLTDGLLDAEALAALDPSRSVYAAYLGDPRPVDELAIPTAIPGVTLLAGDRRIRKFDRPEPWEEPPADFCGLRDALAESSSDVVLVDCPPNLAGCSWSALLAADGLVIPFQPEDYAAKGLTPVREFAEMAARHNPSLRLLGYLLTMVQPSTGLHKTYSAKAVDTFGALLFEARIPRAITMAEAITHRMSIGQYKPRSAAARAVEQLAGEILARAGIEAAVAAGGAR